MFKITVMETVFVGYMFLFIINKFSNNENIKCYFKELQESYLVLTLLAIVFGPLASPIVKGGNYNDLLGAAIIVLPLSMIGFIYRKHTDEDVNLKLLIFNITSFLVIIISLFITSEDSSLLGTIIPGIALILVFGIGRIFGRLQIFCSVLNIILFIYLNYLILTIENIDMIRYLLFLIPVSWDVITGSLTGNMILTDTTNLSECNIYKLSTLIIIVQILFVIAHRCSMSYW